jgi:transposase
MDLTDQQWSLLQPLFADYDLERAASPSQYIACPGSTEVHPEQSEVSTVVTNNGSILSTAQSPQLNPGCNAGAKDIGRPPIQPRPILDGILWKIRNNAPWESLPRGTGDLPARYPSHQTCYRRYRQWRRDGLLDRIFITLYEDLLTRGDFDLHHALRVGSIFVTYQGNRFRVYSATELLDTWQLSTALVFIQLALTWLKKQSS